MNHDGVETNFINIRSLVRSEKTIFIPQKFKEEIELHICKNMLADNNSGFEVPLLLVISGPPGMGKTYQTEAVLREMGVSVININGGEFEDRYAGEPAKRLTQEYINASEEIRFKNSKATVILINDADSAIGDWGGLVQYTMNRQLICKVLIDLCDSPRTVTHVNENDSREIISTRRIPIILTLNDESKIYPPLLRPGRAKIFKWIANRDESVSIIKTMYCNIQHNDAEYVYDTLLEYAKNTKNKLYEFGLPISVFNDIKASMINDIIIEILEKYGFDCFIKNINTLIESEGFSYSVGKIIAEGKRIIQPYENYLGRDENGN